MQDLDCAIFTGMPGEVENNVNVWLRDDNPSVYSVSQSSMPDGTMALTVFYEVGK